MTVRKCNRAALDKPLMAPRLKKELVEPRFPFMRAIFYLTNLVKDVVDGILEPCELLCAAVEA